MKKALLIIIMLRLFILFPCLTNQTFASSPSCLADSLTLDFSQTQFSFIDPMESWFIFKFKATNIGTQNLLIHFSQYCAENPGGPITQAPQGDTPLAPGESMWFKMVFQSGSCGYDPNVLQTINRTFCITLGDKNNNWAPPDNTLSINKTIQINVVANSFSPQGSVLIQGTTIDEKGALVPNVAIDLGAYGAKIPISSDDTGHFSYSIAESPVYFLIAQKERLLCSIY